MTDYPDYYIKAQKIYPYPTKTSLYDIGVVSLQYLHDKQMIYDIASIVNKRFEDTKHIYYPKESNPKKEVMLRIKDPLSIPHLEDVAEAIIPNIEKHFFSSFIHVSHVYIYRSIATTREPVASWLWHYDNYPTEIHKIIIYLTDVDTDSGPFEYLVDKNKKPIIIEPSRTGENNWNKPKWKGSRVPGKKMKQYAQKGCSVVQVTGKGGSAILLDNNCIHRATVAKKRHRDVLVFQIKPFAKKLDPIISKDWTSSFQHKGLSSCPYNLLTKKE